MPKAKVDNEGFIRAWLASASWADVMAATGMSQAAVAGRAARLRRAGVELPKFKGGRAPVDVARLNEAIRADPTPRRQAGG